MHKKNYTKENLIKNLSLKTGFSRNFSKKIINDLIDSMIKNIKDGSFNLKNIGTFKVIKKNRRIGRNPKTKEIFTISSRKTVSFTVSEKIANQLNKII